MKRRCTLLLLFFIWRPPAGVAEKEVRELFAVFAVTTENSPEAKPWSFEGAVGGKRFSGQYAGPAILTAADLKSVKRDTVEISGAPFPCLDFQLSADGLTKLGGYLKRPRSGALLVMIDGFAYAEVKVPDIRQVAANREPLVVIFPGPYQQTTDHLLVLLEERFRAELGARPAEAPAGPKK